MKEKTIVITGPSDGIGAVIERRLSGNRHKVIIGHSSAETESVARERRSRIDRPTGSDAMNRCEKETTHCDAALQ